MISTNLQFSNLVFVRVWLLNNDIARAEGVLGGVGRETNAALDIWKYLPF